MRYSYNSWNSTQLRLFCLYSVFISDSKKINLSIVRTVLSSCYLLRLVLWFLIQLKHSAKKLCCICSLWYAFRYVNTCHRPEADNKINMNTINYCLLHSLLHSIPIEYKFQTKYSYFKGVSMLNARFCCGTLSWLAAHSKPLTGTLSSLAATQNP